MGTNEILREQSLAAVKRGYSFIPEKNVFICLICGEEYRNGVIYPEGDLLLEAELGIQLHIQRQHSGVFDYLISLEKRYNGLSDIQRELINYLNQGKTDAEIARLMGNKSLSTIRNQRFQLREKKREARLFLAIMDLMEEKEDKSMGFIDFDSPLTVDDDRIKITEEENRQILEKYFEDLENLRMDHFPKKQKMKLVLLRRIAQEFPRDRKFTEKEVNDTLRKINSDYVTIRRYLIEYGFMDRENDCSAYWVR